MTGEKQSRKKDAYTIVLENIHSDFKLFGESLDFVRSEVKGHSSELKRHTGILTAMQEDLEILKAEVALL